MVELDPEQKRLAVAAQRAIIKRNIVKSLPFFALGLTTLMFAEMLIHPWLTHIAL